MDIWTPEHPIQKTGGDYNILQNQTAADYNALISIKEFIYVNTHSPIISDGKHTTVDGIYKLSLHAQLCQYLSADTAVSMLSVFQLWQYPYFAI